HTNRPLTDFGGKTSIFSHPVYLFLREFSLQDFRGGSEWIKITLLRQTQKQPSFYIIIQFQLTPDERQRFSTGIKSQLLLSKNTLN
ncbi:hypothetical protein, partial [Escherichia coli]|uniref:hypothetical protein n=1 Tax=Escherichia coli TaxID=562 RepID=UPI002AFEDEE1